MRVLFLSVLLAAPAAADVDFDKDAREDLALISTCFDAAETSEAAQGCVNLTYEGCLGRMGREPIHPDQAGCNRRELALWDHLLSIQERNLEAWSVLKDNEIAQKAERSPFAHQTFLKAQENWAKYRVAQCVFDVQQVAGGTAAITVGPHCEMDLVVERMFALRAFLREIKIESQP
ncbi:lysozyme inhibitor LprI family protein [Tabrizicola sp.]|uniref:lysozyme inhibitor LprI family protein n=1 Tax=Tabrizicola sp. TaxID=2005166 RepID=UPI001A38F63B|nr:lysozyme inhibitor LprI family protein [Tabrizicola sp.]MBL9073503.1 DUF1311 domain-containing protein [Tabrizicola sp.]